MKSLILKDMYNIGHNAKSMFFMLLVFAFVMIPFSSVEGYLFTSTILCSMMTVTTFAFDDHSSWPRYAMVTPISKKDLVRSKFIVLLIFSAIGAVCGLIIGVIGGLLTKKLVVNTESFLSLLFLAFVALAVTEILGSMSVPLVFKFGAEKGRMLLLISFLVPVVIAVGIFQLLKVMGIILTDQTVFILLCLSPVVALIWNYLMYKISCGIFFKKEF